MRKSILLTATIALSSVLLLCSASHRRPTLFMVGDSTMADKTELTASPERGWAQLFPTYLTDDILVQNHAMNGRSTKSYRDEGRWDSVLVRIHKGDIVMIEFGHNDAKVNDPKRFSSEEQYEENLVRMATEAKKKGAKVIICTPICRRNFNAQGDLVYTHAGYPAAAKRAAKRVNAPMLDLETASAEWLRGLGDEASKAYYMNVAPGECTKFPDGKIDDTHLREAGALAIGQMAANLILQQNVKPLKKYIRQTPSNTPIYTTFCRPSFK